MFPARVISIVLAALASAMITRVLRQANRDMVGGPGEAPWDPQAQAHVLRLPGWLLPLGALMVLGLGAATVFLILEYRHEPFLLWLSVSVVLLLFCLMLFTVLSVPLERVWISQEGLVRRTWWGGRQSLRWDQIGDLAVSRIWAALVFYGLDQTEIPVSLYFKGIDTLAQEVEAHLSPAHYAIAWKQLAAARKDVAYAGALSGFPHKRIRPGREFYGLLWIAVGIFGPLSGLALLDADMLEQEAQDDKPLVFPGQGQIMLRRHGQHFIHLVNVKKYRHVRYDGLAVGGLFEFTLADNLGRPVPLESPPRDHGNWDGRRPSTVASFHGEPGRHTLTVSYKGQPGEPNAVVLSVNPAFRQDYLLAYSLALYATVGCLIALVVLAVRRHRCRKRLLALGFILPKGACAAATEASVSPVEQMRPGADDSCGK